MAPDTTATDLHDPARRSRVLAWIGVLVPLALIGALVVLTGLASPDTTRIETAADFSLPDTAGRTVTLDDVLADGPALLYFSMGVGCDGCFAQIPEISAPLADRGVRLVPVMANPIDSVRTEARRFDLDLPVLVDDTRTTAAAYGMLGMYGHGDWPSHSFALVAPDRTITTVKYYAEMFVPASQLLDDLGL